MGKRKRPRNSIRTDEKDIGPSGNLPGFYWDPVKKAYFQILGSQHGHSSSTVTHDSLKLKDLNKALSTPSAQINVNILKLLNDRLFSFLSARTTCRQYIERGLQTSNNHRQISIGDSYRDGEVEHISQLVPNDEFNKILCCRVIKGHYSVNCLQVVDNIDTSSRNPGIRLGLSKSSEVVSPHIVTCADWAENNDVVYCSNMGLHDRSCTVRIIPQAYFSDVDAPSAEIQLTVHRLNAHSCSWSTSDSRLVLGTSTGTVLLHPYTRRMWHLTEEKHEVWTTAVDNERKMVFSGCHSGLIIASDSRQRKPAAGFTINDAVRIVHIRALRDWPIVACAGYPNQLCLVDLRMKKRLLSFNSYHNSNSHILFNLSHDQRYLCSGDDSWSTHVWRVTDGSHVCEWSSPVARDSVSTYDRPRSVFNTWTNFRPSLVLGFRSNFYVYDGL